MELRHLRYFIAVAEELHFGRAAERLHIAQPPLSQQIRDLEVELGVQLLHRTKRSVQLTAAGQIFLKEARLTLAQARQAVKAAQQAARGEIGQLVVGFVGSAAYDFLPKIVRVFRGRFPNVELILHELTTVQQIQALQEQQIHIGFVRPPIYDNTLVIESIVQEPLVVVLPENHPLTSQLQIPLRVLAREPFVLFPRPLAPGLYDKIISFCQQAGFSPQVVQEATQMHTIVSLVAAGIGVALVPASLQNLQRTSVIYKPLQESTPKVEIAAIWREDERSPPAIQSFLSVVREMSSKLN